MNSNILFFNGHPKYNLSSELIQKSFAITFGKYTAKYNFYIVPFGYIPDEYKNKSTYITREDKPLYEKADDFDFSNNTGYNTIDLSKFGYDEEQIKKINEIILKGGAVSIPLS